MLTKTCSKRFGLLAPLVCAALLTLAGCGGSSDLVGDTNGRVTTPTPSPTPSDSVPCTTVVLPGLQVTVTDGATGQPLTSGVTVTVQDGDFSETLVSPQPVDGTPLPDPHVFRAAHERKGTYTIRVTRDGYAPFERSGVTVTADECHVTTVALNAPLTPTP